MKKVPIIQEKSAQYHASEAKQADALLQGALDNAHQEEAKKRKTTTKVPQPWYKRLWKKITMLLGL